MPRMTSPKPGEPIRLVTTKSGEPRYQVVLTSSGKGATKRQQVRRNFATLAQARAFVDETRTAVRRGAFTASDTTTLAELAERWLTSRTDIRAVSVEGYRQALKAITTEHGTRRVQSIKRADVERWVESWRTSGGVRGRGVSHRSVVYMLGALRQVLAYGVQHGITASNAAEGVKPPRKRPEDHHAVTVWTVPELARFLAHVDTYADGERFSGEPWLRAAFRMTLCGLRRSEVLGLDWTAVDLAAGTVEVRQSRVKTGRAKTTATDDPKSSASRRTVPVESIHPGTVAALRALWLVQGRPASGLVVVNGAGEGIHPDAYGDRFRALCAAAEVPTIRLHAIRHTIATALHDAGEAPAAVAKMLGHEVTTHLAFYVKATDDSAQRAASRFGAILSATASG